jgi:signal transduction histidine kinase/ActR/RegA family two-component response regulator
VIAPLLAESEVFGVLLAARRAPSGFSSGECEFLQQLAEHTALAAQQAELHTALQTAYDELRRTQQAVMQQERLRALGQMASGLAHDINNAISPVTLYTDFMLDKDPELNPRTREYLQIIRLAVRDVAATVARMREFYRERDEQAPLVAVQLNLLVPQVIDLTRASWSDMALRKGTVIHVATELASDLPSVMGVESELREALTNLVLNAVDAMPEGGMLTLRTSLDKLRGTSASATARPVLVEVVDNGSGMDEETRRRCLEPFYTTKGERGTGLGLAMVYGTIQRHGGEIEIESTPGQGTLMRLRFPLPRSLVAPAPRASATQGSPLRILVVDDDPIVLRSLQQSLTGYGHAVSIAGGGQAGLDAFRAARAQGAPFEVVITDLGMPHLDGRKVAAAVKAADPSTPVILLTGWGQRLVAENEVPPHVDRVLSKPPALQDLLATLAELAVS